MGENSKNAIKREMNEELGVVIKDSFLFLINETMFTRKDGIKVQELSIHKVDKLINKDFLLEHFIDE